MTGDRQFREFTAQQRDWLVGRNPWGMTMFTEIGSGSDRLARDDHPTLQNVPSVAVWSMDRSTSKIFSA